MAGPKNNQQQVGGGQEFTQTSEQAAKSKAKVKVNTKTKAAEEQKQERVRCCGTLCCKGKQPGCFFCSVCMDCISGIGCGHNDSTHDPEKHIVLPGGGA